MGMEIRYLDVRADVISEFVVEIVVHGVCSILLDKDIAALRLDAFKISYYMESK